MSVDRCSEVWHDGLFDSTHVCDRPEGHTEPHWCHCDTEKPL